MSRPVIETKVVKTEPTHSTVRTGKEYYVPSLAQYIQIVALDGSAGAINKQYGHRIAGSIVHPGMNKDYTVAEAREILGKYADELGVIPSATEKTEEITTLKVGDYIRFSKWGTDRLYQVVRSDNYKAVLVGPSGDRWSDPINIDGSQALTVSQYRTLVSGGTDGVILDKSEVPAAIAKALGVSLEQPKTTKRQVALDFYYSTGGDLPRIHTGDKVSAVDIKNSDVLTYGKESMWTTFSRSSYTKIDSNFTVEPGDTLKVYRCCDRGYIVADQNGIAISVHEGVAWKLTEDFKPSSHQKLLGTIQV